jgi:phenylalanyl-tRNA synthetase beta chain
MNASYEWLKDFTDFVYSPAELRELITSRAVTVDEVVSLREDLKDIVVGRVVEAKPHPNSDHLWLTQVDAGGEELLDVVCGAPNVVVGTLYPFAPVGATLPGGFKIEKRKIRGEFSNGMLCSARELGLGVDHAGIMALDMEVAPGTPFLDALPIGDTRLVLDVGANRADLLAHEGVAREIAAATGNPLRRPVIANAPPVPECIVAEQEGTTGNVRVRVDDPEGCPLYIAVVIRGVTIGPSPDWLVKRLEGAGVRSISNVVDATNYMLHGFGQPMHAFDLSKLEGESIIVRRAQDKERLVTLDGVDRTLDSSMVVIADASHAQAIAGVIGGEKSEVNDLTTDILLEVAVFNPRSIRATRRKLGISTDASYRYERAMDTHACAELARYAAALIVSLAGGRVDGAPLMIGGPKPAPEAIRLRCSRVEQVLGDPVSSADCAKFLQSVGFVVEGSASDTLTVTPPTWRSDVTLEVDLIEEIARLRGYDTFSNELRPFRLGTVPDAPSYVVGKRVTEALVSAGLYEVRPIPFVADAGERGVRLLNPMAENEGMLRSTLLSTLGRRAEYNFAHMVRNIRLFEVGVVFSQAPSPGELPIERTHAAVVLSGDRFPQHFTNAKPPQVDIWDAKYIAELIGDVAFGKGRLTLTPSSTGEGWVAEVDGATVGTVGPITLDTPVWASPVFGIEIDITSAFSAERRLTTYKKLPTTPAAEFDLALLVPESVSAETVEQTIRSAAGDLLEAVTPFDEFRGKGIESGFRSVAWRLTLRHPERTLREKEIEGRRDNILRTLDQELGVRQRTS